MYRLDDLSASRLCSSILASVIPFHFSFPYFPMGKMENESRQHVSKRSPTNGLSNSDIASGEERK